MTKNYAKFKKYSNYKYLNLSSSKLKNILDQLNRDKLAILELISDYDAVAQDLHSRIENIEIDDRIYQECIKLRKIRNNNKPKKSKGFRVGNWIKCSNCDIKTQEFYENMLTCKSCHKDNTKRYKNKKYKEDEIFRTIKNLRDGTYRAFTSKKWKRNKGFYQYIGCFKHTLIKHIESQFVDGMSWENQGEWHIDHIIPLSSAKNKQHLYKLCHYTNLQPLWAKDNIKKGAKLPHQLD